jgi:nucleoid DNA-binding protein
MVANNILLQLKSENRVFINGLGMFSKQLISARQVRGKLQPPKYKLIFDEEAQGNGFNFVLKLSKNEKLRITDADKQVHQWVASIKQALSENGSCTIDDFGTFSLLKSGKTGFRNGKLSLLNREFEGMEEIELPHPTEKNKVENVEAMPLTVPVVEIEEVKESPVVDEEVKKDEKDNKEKRDNEEKKKRSSWWLFILIILLALALLVWLFKEPIFHYTIELKEKYLSNQHIDTQENTINTVINSDTISTLPNNPDSVIIVSELEPVPVPVPDVVQKSITPQNTVTPRQKMVAEQSAVDIEITAEQIMFQAGKFYLISGSFTTPQEAQKHIIVSGFDKYHASILLQNGNNRCRVCLGIFDSETDAEQYRALLNIPGWVLKE